MKINETLLRSSPVVDSKKGEKGKIKEFDFQKIMKEADEKLKEADGKVVLPQAEKMPDSVLIPESIPRISIQAVNHLELGKATELRSQSIEKTEKALEILETYQKALSDPEMELKKIDPIVRALSEEVKNLNALSGKLPISDPLQKLLTEVGIVSTVEIEKFNRGEYI